MAALLLLSSAASAQLPPPPVPAGNPITVEKARLGKALFWDEQLSSTRTVSCGTCHIPEAGGADPRSILPTSVNPGADGVFGTADDVKGSPGVPRSTADGTYRPDALFGFHEQVTGRQAPSAINAGYSPSLFWDGRAESTLVDPLTNQVVLTDNAALESQVLGPPVSEAEMGHEGRDWQDVITRVTASTPLALSDFVPADLDNWIAGRSYAELFQEVFGTSEVSASRVAMAIATYERTLHANQTPWDSVLSGVPAIQVMTPQEIGGAIVFLGGPPGTKCDRCHGPDIVRLSDDQFHYIGVRPHADDPGRFAVTGDPRDMGAMRTPAMRNVALRAPYFHDGSASTLAEVVDFYERGGDFSAHNLAIDPFPMTALEKHKLALFLGRPLLDPRVVAGLPPFDRPSQYADSDHVPELYGQGTVGSGGFTPRMIAKEPPLIGNSQLTVAVADALGGARAALVLGPSQDLGGLPFHGSTLYVSGNLQLMAIPMLMGTGNGEGVGSLVLQAPTSLGSIGTSLYMQWFVLDPGAPLGVSASQAVKMTWF